jgi:hypothetical protein
MRCNFANRPTARGRLLPTGALAALLVGHLLPAYAEPRESMRYAIDQPSQALADSLRSMRCTRRCMMC